MACTKRALAGFAGPPPARVGTSPRAAEVKKKRRPDRIVKQLEGVVLSTTYTVLVQRSWYARLYSWFSLKFRIFPVAVARGCKRVRTRSADGAVKAKI